MAHPDPNSTFNYRRGAKGEILTEEEGEIPRDKEDGWSKWVYEMRKRFVEGRDGDFEYESVDEEERYDDKAEEDREALDQYLEDEKPAFVDSEGREKEDLEGETGIQDF